MEFKNRVIELIGVYEREELARKETKNLNFFKQFSKVKFCNILRKILEFIRDKFLRAYQSKIALFIFPMHKCVFYLKTMKNLFEIILTSVNFTFRLKNLLRIHRLHLMQLTKT